MFFLDNSPSHRWKRGLPLDPELTGQLAPEDLRLPLPHRTPVLTPALSVFDLLSRLPSLQTLVKGHLGVSSHSSPATRYSHLPHAWCGNYMYELGKQG